MVPWVMLLQLLRCCAALERGSRHGVVALSGHPGCLSGGAGGLALATARASADAPAGDLS